MNFDNLVVYSYNNLKTHSLNPRFSIASLPRREEKERDPGIRVKKQLFHCAKTKSWSTEPLFVKNNAIDQSELKGAG